MYDECAWHVVGVQKMFECINDVNTLRKRHDFDVSSGESSALQRNVSRQRGIKPLWQVLGFLP